MEICNILGVNINVTNMIEMLNYISSNLNSLKGKYICVSNVHTTVIACENQSYKNIQNKALINLPDGRPLSVLSKLRGFKEAKRVTGPDLMEEVFKISELRGYTHFFYGSTNEILHDLKVKLIQRYPQIEIKGIYSPPFRELSKYEDQEIVQQINLANPDFLWVGLGAPKQEIWMYNHRNIVSALMIGVGAGFDYHSGKLKRAPEWMQWLSLEWFYRLLQQPKKLIKRYLFTNLKFIYYLVKDIIFAKKY
jgi:N-acetylglucosaminyldiphosphoundecaprenol N-acetyl-beta-D-mannosaminyltransferase